MSSSSSIKSILPTSWRRVYRNIKLLFTADFEFTLRRLDYDERSFRGLAELFLKKNFPSIIAPYIPQNAIHAKQGKIFSQYGEDGMLLHIFQLIGVKYFRFVEFGVSDGRENLSNIFGLLCQWKGVVMEANPKISEKARSFYRTHLIGPAADRITLIEALVTPTNINDLLCSAEMTGEIDFLSIDIDSHDYWVWKAIKVISPRVVVIEYNSFLGKHEPLTIPLDPNFDRYASHPFGYYYGTSLSAAVKLGKEKGYTFVGCEPTGGVNAFFIRNDVMISEIEEVTVEQGFIPQMRRAKLFPTADQQFEQIKHLPLEKV
ncbi:hypothetical protein IT408_02480 [Candidatus Uhrbacteria bacterium]|nr:hypothetical protein [Candidatus Uhrbacteria bacterium]